MMFPEASNPLFISPHLDDAVLSCGELIARWPGAVVATIFAGLPPHPGQLTAWDAASGFASAREAIAARRAEDSRALSLLGAAPHWLDFCDSQYGPPPSLLALARAVEKMVRQFRPDAVLLPAGLFHSDHALVHRASLSLLGRHAGIACWMYEEASYRRLPGLLQERLAALRQRRIRATPAVAGMGGEAARKREAVLCYASQLRALQAKVKEGYADAFAPEGYWRLQPAGAGGDAP